jgi:arsenate reductase
MEKRHVIFVCTGNSARSQMAEAFLRKYGGDRFIAHSAGMEPREINPLTIQVMEEVGISLDGHHPKSTKEFLGQVPIRFAIMVCEQAEKECPRLWPFGATALSWPFDDPAAFEGSEPARLEKFRVVRNEFEACIQQWLDEIKED